ncbi:MAG TPA: polyphosphate kinase 1, partial [Chitinophagaceae bacterium]|nr:polyphosphate kinase 1 [Chitinophagaceae bacterium]
MTNYTFFDRDISWLSFNERILMEAAKDDVPLTERIKFLSIYSSNLDEFYRVRIPALMLSKKIEKVKGRNEFHTEPGSLYDEITEMVSTHLQKYGNILTQQIIPQLKQQQIHFVYNENIPLQLKQDIQEYFFSQMLAFIQPVYLSQQKNFFPENNKLYLAVITAGENMSNEIIVVNIP